MCHTHMRTRTHAHMHAHTHVHQAPVCKLLHRHQTYRALKSKVVASICETTCIFVFSLKNSNAHDTKSQRTKEQTVESPSVGPGVRRVCAPTHHHGLTAPPVPGRSYKCNLRPSVSVDTHPTTKVHGWMDARGRQAVPSSHDEAVAGVSVSFPMF